jgi:hypothetical protein
VKITKSLEFSVQSSVFYFNPELWTLNTELNFIFIFFRFFYPPSYFHSDSRIFWYSDVLQIYYLLLIIYYSIYQNIKYKYQNIRTSEHVFEFVFYFFIFCWKTPKMNYVFSYRLAGIKKAPENPDAWHQNNLIFNRIIQIIYTIFCNVWRQWFTEDFTKGITYIDKL